MMSYIKRYLRGIEVNEETLAVDPVRSAGIGGNFLDQPHTAEHFRQEFFMPRMLCRNRREAWMGAGSRRLDETAEDIADSLMNKPASSGLSAEQENELDRIITSFLKSRS